MMDSQTHIKHILHKHKFELLYFREKNLTNIDRRSLYLISLKNNTKSLNVFALPFCLRYETKCLYLSYAVYQICCMLL